MSLKKTLILIIILAVLTGVVYSLRKSPKKTKTEGLLFPEFNTEQVNEIVINGPINKVKIIKEGDKWIVPEQDNLQADSEMVKQAIEGISQITRENIISTNPEKQEIFEVDPNKGFEVEIKGENDKSQAHIFIGKNGPDFISTYLRANGSNEVLLYRGFHLKSRFDKSPDMWVDKTMTNIDENEIKQIEFQRPDQTYTVSKEDEIWSIISPETFPSNEEEVKKILSTLTSSRAMKVQRIKQDQTLQDFGLDNPFLAINITLFDGTSETLIFSKKEEKQDQYYAQLSDKNDLIYTVGKYIIDKLDVTLEKLKAVEPPQEESQPGEKAVQEPSTEKVPISLNPE